MDVQMPVRKPFATEYLSSTEENGALGNIFTELYETLGFLERNYQSTPGCTEQIKNLLTGSPLVSLPKTMDFTFYDQAQHEINVEQQPSYYETSLNNSKGTWMPMEVTDAPPVQYNQESLYSRKPDRILLYEENKKTDENQQNIVSSSAALLPRKRKMEVMTQENKVQIMCNMGDAPPSADNSSRILQEQFKNNSKYSNLSRIGWPAEELSLTDDDDLDASYNISDALLSLSSLTNLKQEPPGGSKLNQNRPVNSDPHEVNSGQKTTKDRNDENVCFQELLHGAPSHELSNCKMIENTPNTAMNVEVPYNIMNKSDTKDCRFQYVLGAATSIATKTNEESLTYLNQRQSYEIKLKKLGDLTAYKGKILKTIIRICFHERRLQFMEREQIKLWKEAHPGEKIIDIDVPLSYGLHRIAKQCNTDNSVELFWDPMKETGIYIKVNCISTEFTPKKHGGEKGVPFRIQVETYLSKADDNFHESTNGELLHAAFCQIRVFKLKGADRKHKQDRDKILKRSPLEQKRYKPSCECTILNNMSCDLILANYPQMNHMEQRDATISPSGSSTEVTNANMTVKNAEIEIAPNNSAANSPVSIHSESLFNEGVPLCQDTNTERMSQWLQNNRFSAYLTTFSHFSGSDIWSLSREDLIQICGVPDGIRLYNSLHTKIKSVPCLTFYVCSDVSSPCNAIYMQTLTATEFIFKIRQFITSSKSAENSTGSDEMNNSHLKLPFYILGPGGIHVVLTNELISNIQEKTIFSICIEQDKVILKTINKYE